MQSLSPNFYMILFSTSLMITYLVVRTGKVSTGTALRMGILVNSMFFFLYSTARGNSLPQALLVAVTLSALFTILSVILGATFHSSASVETVKGNVERVKA